MTIGVYGLVACIVKLDDLGLCLTRREGSARVLGGAILRAAPLLMKTLSILGTAAMFLVGGGILVHGISPLHHGIEHVIHPWGVRGGLASALFNGFFGIAAGAAVLLALKPFLQRQH